VRGGSGSLRNRRSTQASCVGAMIFFTTWLRLNLPPPRQARWEAAPCGTLPRHRACLGGKPVRRRRNAPHVPRTRPSLATKLGSVENRLDAEGTPHTSRAHAPSLATELGSVENRLDAEGIPHTSRAHAPSLATELASVENRLDAEGMPHTSLPRHRACLGGGGRAAELRAAGRAESYVPASRDPSVGWRRRSGPFSERTATPPQPYTPECLAHRTNGGKNQSAMAKAAQIPGKWWHSGVILGINEAVRYSGCHICVPCAHVSKRTTGA